MKVVIAGSRGITQAYPVWVAIASAKYDITEVVSGGAKGVDETGEIWAFKHHVPVRRFLPDWQAHGKAAGPIRNAEMVDYADAVIAVWDGKSRGTEYTIKYAQRKGKPVFVHRVDAAEPAAK